VACLIACPTRPLPPVTRMIFFSLPMTKLGILSLNIWLKKTYDQTEDSNSKALQDECHSNSRKTKGRELIYEDATSILKSRQMRFTLLPPEGSATKRLPHFILRE
jgi:hypothetical protein